MAVSAAIPALFAPVTVPKLKIISRNAILSFLADRQHYETLVEAHPGLKPIIWTRFFDALMLRSLVRARVFGKVIISVDQLNETIIKETLVSFSRTTRQVSFD